MRVGSRRGCKTVTWPLPSKPPSSSICGTWVDFPEPVGAVRISRFCAVKVSSSRCLISKMGRSDCRIDPGYLKVFAIAKTCH
jgi:hypothetical protein